jgi:hemolysin-activating ACP:hemolysin acyltransferase
MSYTHWNNPDRDVMFKALGEATSVLLNSERKRYKIASIGAFLFPYARLNQLKLFYGENHYPAAYMTWAYVTDKVLRRVRARPEEVLDIEDLNAGDNLLVTDIVSLLRSFRPIIHHIQAISEDSHNKVYGIRYSKSQQNLVVRDYRPRRRVATISVSE